MSTCTGCGAEIVWAQTTKGKRIPLDAVSRIDGNIELSTGGVATVLTHARRAELANELLDANRAGRQAPLPRLYVSHFATCPQAKAFRRPGPIHLEGGT